MIYIYIDIHISCVHGIPPPCFCPGIPSFFIEMLPHCRVDVVELEAEVVEASKDVGFQRDPRISITVQDGAIFAQDAILGGAL